jgi:hypothetical protein
MVCSIVTRGIGLQNVSDMGSSLTAPPSPHYTDLIEKLYTLVERNAVRGFIARNPSIALLLEEAHHQIETYFPQCRKELKLVRDPDGGDQRILKLAVVTRLSPSEATFHLDELDEAWWLDVSDTVDDKMILDVEFA